MCHKGRGSEDAHHYVSTIVYSTMRSFAKLSMIFFSPLYWNLTVAIGLWVDPSMPTTSPNPNFWCSTFCPTCNPEVSLATKSGEGLCSMVFKYGLGGT